MEQTILPQTWFPCVLLPLLPVWGWSAKGRNGSKGGPVSDEADAVLRFFGLESTHPGRAALPVCPGPVRGLPRPRGRKPDSFSGKRVAQRGRVGLSGELKPRTDTRNTAQQQPFWSLSPCLLEPLLPRLQP